jgi:hypothetical protein
MVQLALWLLVSTSAVIATLLTVALFGDPRSLPPRLASDSTEPEDESTPTHTLEARLFTPSAIESTKVIGEAAGSWLMAIDGQGVYRVNGHLVVGRGPDCQIRLRDPHISRRHFELREDGGVCTLIDLGSRNGVFVNDVSVQTRVLADNDVICVGRRFFRFKSVH